MQELIERLEKATGPDRVLDGHIRQLVEPRPPGILPETPCPGYTSSIDAALTLVPKDAVWHVMTDYGDLNRAKVGPAGRPSASIYNGDYFHEADAETPALALCIAALMARS